MCIDYRSITSPLRTRSPERCLERIATSELRTQNPELETSLEAELDGESACENDRSGDRVAITLRPRESFALGM